MFDNKYPYTDYHELNLDWFMGEFKKLVAEWEETKGEWNTLHDYVQNYFENLNVQTEIDNKINAMILDGTFADIVSPFVTAALPALVAGQLPNVVAAQISAVVAAQISAVVADQLPAVAAAAAAAEVGDWLTAHIDPDTGYVIDDTLTVQNAAADAKATGEALSVISNKMTLYNSPNLCNLDDVVTGKYVNLSGSEQSSDSYRHSGYIPVTESDTLYFSRRTTNDVTMTALTVRFVTAYDSNKTAVQVSGVENADSYTVPTGISYIIVSYPNYSTMCVSVGSIPDFYEVYGSWYLSTSDFLKDTFNDKTSQTKKSKGYYTVTGDLNATESLTIPRTNVKKNRALLFSGKLSDTFTSITIGQNVQNYDATWLVINNSKVILHRYLDAEYTVELDHNLTFSDYVAVNIWNNVDDVRFMYFEIITNGGKYTSESYIAYMDTNADYTVNVGQGMTDCVFTFAVMDANKDCWILGDSYMTLGTSSRIPYYFSAKNIIDNILVNGYPGEAPATGLTAFKSLLANYGRCRYALFALGMNGGEDGVNSVDTTFRNTVNEFILRCKEYDITPILCTIPTVPGRYHEPRNIWIRSLGYQYVDLARAVGAQADGTWYSGLLSSDNVHPTEAGAEVLADAIIREFPQMMQNE